MNDQKSVLRKLQDLKEEAERKSSEFEMIKGQLIEIENRLFEDFGITPQDLNDKINDLDEDIKIEEISLNKQLKILKDKYNV